MLIRRFKDLESLSQFGADYIASLAAGKPFSMALSGGSTPKMLYELLPMRREIDWHQVQVFLGDERYVPSSDVHSNERMIREALIDHIDLPEGSFHAMYDPAGWTEAAETYDGLLHRFFAGKEFTFDLAIQGMGDDGHTASIFPGTAAFEQPAVAGTWVVTTESPVEPTQRVSATLEVLAAARLVVFLVTGEGKAARLREVIDGDRRYPSAVLAGMAKNVEWWIDEAAATLLD